MSDGSTGGLDPPARHPGSGAGRPAAGGVGPWWAEGPLEWRQPRGRGSEWELFAGEEPIGRLSVRGNFRERVSLTGPTGSWSLAEHWTGRAEITLAGTQAPAARFRPRFWGGGVILTASAFRYTWDRRDFLGRVYAIANDSGFECVRFLLRSSLRRLSGTVVVEPTGRRIPEIEPLVLLGWRLIVAAGRRGR